MDGFDSLTRAPFAPPDLGFGYPSTSSRDWGFGSPTPPRFTGASIVSSRTVSRAGGDVVILSGHWRVSGPFRARLVDASGSFFPSDAYGCTAPPRYGEAFEPVTRKAPWDVQTTRGPQGVGRYVTFVVPSGLAPGMYSIRLDWVHGPMVLVNALRVVELSPSPATWAIRRLMVNSLKTGPRLSESEALAYTTEDA